MFTVEHEVNVDMVCLLWESGGIIVQLDTAATLGLSGMVDAFPASRT